METAAPPYIPRIQRRARGVMLAEPMTFNIPSQLCTAPHPEATQKHLIAPCPLVPPAPYLLLAREWEVRRGVMGSNEERKGTVGEVESGVGCTQTMSRVGGGAERGREGRWKLRENSEHLCMF